MIRPAWVCLLQPPTRSKQAVVRQNLRDTVLGHNRVVIEIGHDREGCRPGGLGCAAHTSAVLGLTRRRARRNDRERRRCFGPRGQDRALRINDLAAQFGRSVIGLYSGKSPIARILAKFCRFQAEGTRYELARIHGEGRGGSQQVLPIDDRTRRPPLLQYGSTTRDRMRPAPASSTLKGASRPPARWIYMTSGVVVRNSR